MLFSQYYLQVYVNNTQGDPLPNTNIKITDNKDTEVYLGSTDSYGWIPIQRITDYLISYGNKDNKNDYTINATYYELNNYTTVNMSESKFVYFTFNNLEVTSVKLEPETAKTTEDLKLNASCYSASSSTVNISWEIYKNNVLQNSLSNSKIINSDVSTNVYNISNSLTSKGEIWYAIVQCHEADTSSSPKTSNNATIVDTAPTVPQLLSPTNNTRSMNTTPTLVWSASTDADNDPITYYINITEISCSDTHYCTGSDNRLYSTTNTNFTIPTALQLSATYEWKVLASDSEENSSWSKIFRLKTNNPPTQGNPVLKASDNPLNRTTADLYCYNESTYDSDNDKIYNVYNWYINNSAIDVLNMPFDNNVSTTANGAIKDYSPYGNNGTLGGGNSANAPKYESGSNCQIGGCYNFDGNDYIKLDSTSSKYNFAGPTTLSFWIKPGVQPYTYSGPFRYDSGGTNGWIVYMTNENIVFKIGNKTIVNDGVGGSFPLPQDSWSFITYVYDSHTFYVYINGILKGTHSSLPNMSSYDSILNIGFADGSQYFNGSIDNVKIYNVALTSEQILQDYEAGLAHHQDNIINSTMTVKGQNWKCSITPNDQINSGIMKESNQLKILDSAPTTPILISPLDDTSTTNITPTFIWNASTDPDNDELTYYININEINCSDTEYCNGSDNRIYETSNTNLTLTKPLQVDATYEWRVLASDSEENSTYSLPWNITIEPYVSIELIHDTTNFGTLLPNETENTTLKTIGSTNGPLVIKNNGDVYTNVKINASPMWADASMNTNYYQFEINNVTGVTNAYNYPASLVSWTNMSNNQQNAVNNFNYTTGSNEARIDILIKVPQYEPPGTKQSSISISAVQS